MALGCGVVAVALLAFKPAVPPEASLALGVYFFFAFGLPMIFATVAVTGLGYLVSGFWARWAERGVPPPADPHKLLESAKSPAFELPVHGSAQFGVGIAMLLIGAPLLYGGAIEKIIVFLLAGAVMIALGILGLLHSISVAGKPKLVLAYGGFSTPLAPFIPWSQVQGIQLRTNEARGHVLSHSLMFRIDCLPQRIGEFALFHRIQHKFRIGAGKRKFHVVLRHSSEPPEVVHRLAQALWTQRTGLDHDWRTEIKELQKQLRMVHWLALGGTAAFLVYLAWRLLAVFAK